MDKNDLNEYLVELGVITQKEIDSYQQHKAEELFKENQLENLRLRELYPKAVKRKSKVYIFINIISIKCRVSLH
jgi:hypothetical protein